MDSNPKPQTAGRFYVWMAAICVLIAVGGFAPTYWLQLVPGTFIGPPLLHIHGALFTAWTLLLLIQALLQATGHKSSHRAFGLAGIALASAMVVIGLAAAILTLNHGLAAGYGDRSRAFMILPISSLTLFVGFVIAAIANTRRPEWHKRLMLLATISLLQAAIGRVFFVIVTGGGPGLRPGLGPPGPPAIAVAPGLILELLIVAGIVYDWRTRGKPHPAWLVGGAIMAVVILLRAPIAGTAPWLAFADFLAHIAG